MEEVKNSLYEFYNYLKEVLSDISRNFFPSASTILTQLGAYLIVFLMFCYGVYVVSTLFGHLFPRPNYFDTSAKRVLIVIAHPDDECMFFGPLIVRLLKSEKCVYIMCLSSGNARNLGHIRKYELYNSCKVLGINRENIFLCFSSLRLDGEQYMWKSDSIAALIHDYVESYGIDTVVTFDKHGVSGHKNHCSLFRAASYLSLRNWLPPNCRVFLLESVGILRKYSSLTDCALSLFTSENVLILSFSEHGLLQSAMREHKTQYVWFRKLYMYFSRYTYMNTFHELPRYQSLPIEQQDSYFSNLNFSS